jgi:ribonuclease HII
MGLLHARYPQYAFDRHKGYPTPEHLELLARHGPCAIHRRTFGPVRAFFAKDLSSENSAGHSAKPIPG